MDEHMYFDWMGEIEKNLERIEDSKPKDSGQMLDREKVIKELENAPNTVKDGFYFLRITHKLRDDVLKLLKEQQRREG